MKRGEKAMEEKQKAGAQAQVCPHCGDALILGTQIVKGIIETGNRADDGFFTRKAGNPTIEVFRCSRRSCKYVTSVRGWYENQEREQLKAEGSQLSRTEIESLLREVGVQEKNFDYIVDNWDKKAIYFLKKLEKVRAGWI